MVMELTIWINKSMFVLDKFCLVRFLVKSVAHMVEQANTMKQMIMMNLALRIRQQIMNYIGN
jgi:hypothetical protein